MSLVLVTRRNCHLCDEALAILHDLGAQPDLADVDSDDRLFDQYDWRVPVLMLEGRVVAEGRMTQDQVRKALGLA